MRDLLVIHVHAGNVILPGIFLAFLLRFDTSYGRPRRPFFHLTLLAYAVCLALSVSASEAGASPVEIVYLVPACLGMAAFVGACLREFAAFATYTEEKPRPRSRDDAAWRRTIIAYLLMCVYRSQTPWYFSCRAELLAFPLGAAGAVRDVRVRDGAPGVTILWVCLPGGCASGLRVLARARRTRGGLRGRP